MRHIAIALTLISGLCCACERQHMSDDYSRQSKRFFALQRVNSAAASGSPSGLDSEEASLIQGTYKENMGRPQSSRSDSSSRVMLLQESDSDQGQH